MLGRGAEPMEKRQRRILSETSLFLCHSFMLLSVSFVRSPQPNDRAQRPSERGGVISPGSAFRTYTPVLHFPVPHEALS